MLIIGYQLWAYKALRGTYLATLGINSCCIHILVCLIKSKGQEHVRLIKWYLWIGQMKCLVQHLYKMER